MRICDCKPQKIRNQLDSRYFIGFDDKRNEFEVFHMSIGQIKPLSFKVQNSINKFSKFNVKTFKDSKNRKKKILIDNTIRPIDDIELLLMH